MKGSDLMTPACYSRAAHQGQALRVAWQGLTRFSGLIFVYHELKATLFLGNTERNPNFRTGSRILGLTNGSRRLPTTP